MPSGIYKHGLRPDLWTTICINGHNKSIVGKNPNRSCKECARQRSKESVKNSRWKKYNILNKENLPFTTIDFDREYQLQQGKCKICKKHQSELKKALSADHNHITGIFRGLICQSCNLHLIPVIEKYNNLIEAARDYLK